MTCSFLQHALIYPLDTVRTHIQVCAACIHNNNAESISRFKNPTASPGLGSKALLRSSMSGASSQHLPTGMFQTIRYLVNEPALETATRSQMVVQGLPRLFRGLQTIVIGCIPAHALYFSVYESIKSTSSEPNVITSSLAGAAAGAGHDMVMTPVDTVKQRIQVGHYNGSSIKAFADIIGREGWMALYRSFPVTLASNIPYGMIMVSTHEACKHAWSDPTIPAWQTVLAASSVAGCVASALTTPLDRIKTALQTQQLTPTCARRPQMLARDCIKRRALEDTSLVRHSTWLDAAKNIAVKEGPTGFFRGMLPRMLSHTPAVAISWTTYETAKHYLIRHFT